MNDTLPAGLSALALSALAVLAALGVGDRAAVLHLHGVAAAPRLRPSLDGVAVPRLTQLVPERDRVALYGSAAWAEIYRPVREVLLYALFSAGLGRLAQRLGGGISLAKLGTSTVEGFARRRADLATVAYGGFYRDARRYEREAGFDHFSAPLCFQLAPQHRLSPVVLTSDGIAVRLPPSLSKDQFEAALNRRLLPLRLHVFAGSEAGQSLCARAGIDPAQLRRFCKTGSRYKAATELTLFRAQADSGALARLASDIVIDHTLGIVAPRPER